MKTKSETTRLIKAAIEKENRYIEVSSPHMRNPQIREMVVQSIARVETLKAVLDALNGDMVMLRMFAE